VTLMCSFSFVVTIQVFSTNVSPMRKLGMSKIVCMSGPPSLVVHAFIPFRMGSKFSLWSSRLRAVTRSGAL